MDPLLASLLRPEAYDHPAGPIRLIETHISWVLLTGSFAYKVKKPVNLGFVDFDTLEKRHQACLEEVRLNRRLAPALYLEVVAIQGPPERARVLGAGAVAGAEPIEWAVRMAEFDQSALLPAVLERQGLEAEAFDALAERLALFHRQAAVAPLDSLWGKAAAVAEPALANLAALEACGVAADLVGPLRSWSERTAAELAALFERRRADGRIRECHGDLHLGNMAWLEGRITVFDGIEFSAALRWIDVISDLAFLAMDLERRQRPDLAARVLNRWLECSGDYPGMATWRWYLTYRALVRAKVAALRLAQAELSPAERESQEEALAAYLLLAQRSSTTPSAAVTLAITRGVSGSGKTHLARRLCRRLGWIHLRSDLERKRAFGLPLESPSDGAVPGLYDRDASERLYDVRLPECAAALLEAGMSLIVDATFLAPEHRRSLRRLASVRGARFLILEFAVDPTWALSAIERRRTRGGDPSDADEAVLKDQLRRWQPLGEGEADRVITVAAGFDDDEASLAELAARLKAP
ncbi:AAA family ATPase [Cyanobium sp. FGCU-52]|nr:AAA family ATPase [Cyanobium sp. FGCU52]